MAEASTASPEKRNPATFSLDEQSALLCLRLVIFLLLNFFLLFSPKMQASFSLTPFALVLLYLFSNTALLVVPRERWSQPLVQSALFIFDIVIISLVIYASDGLDSDLYLLYFLVIFMSGLQVEAWQSFLTGTVASLVYLFFWTRGGREAQLMSAQVLLRIPFFYLIAFFVSFLVGQAQKARKRLEQAEVQLMHSDKLAAVGRLAAGVAHELNNPLTSIMGFTQLLLEDEKLTEEQRSSLTVVNDQSQRCRRIISDLLQFSRKNKPKRENVQVSSLLESTMSLAKYDLCKSRVDVDQKCPAPSPTVYADPFQARQVFLNLITNAMHAMQERPTKKLIIRVEEKAGRVRIHFQDTGAGISKKNIDKLFDPFFSTKEAGKGTGLGLSISHGIIASHGGAISVKSREGEGTTFTVELPRGGRNGTT
ncbi:MAG: ATP-binding protein [Elusimicrobiota bacterium]